MNRPISVDRVTTPQEYQWRLARDVPELVRCAVRETCLDTPQLLKCWLLDCRKPDREDIALLIVVLAPDHDIPTIGKRMLQSIHALETVPPYVVLMNQKEIGISDDVPPFYERGEQ